MGIDRKESESGNRRKCAALRAVSALGVGRRWPRPWPTQPGLILREPDAFLAAGSAGRRRFSREAWPLFARSKRDHNDH